MQCRQILSMIMAVCYLATNVTAKPTNSISLEGISCKSGEGVWKKTDDSFVCRPCSALQSYSEHEMIKMPKGCTPLTWGVFLTLESYYQLKKDKAYYLKLDDFLSKINPSLDSLSTTTNNLLDESKRLTLLLDEAKKEMSNIQQKNVELETKNSIILWIAIGGGIIALGSTATLIALVSK